MGFILITNKVYDNKQYEFYKLTINGQEVECNLDETSDSIIVTYTHLVVDEFTIGVHYKQIYTIDVSTD